MQTIQPQFSGRILIPIEPALLAQLDQKQSNYARVSENGDAIIVVTEDKFGYNDRNSMQLAYQEITRMINFSKIETEVSTGKDRFGYPIFDSNHPLLQKARELRNQLEKAILLAFTKPVNDPGVVRDLNDFMTL